MRYSSVISNATLGKQNLNFLSQMMCSRGYSDAFAGLCGSLLLGSGFIGSIVTGIIADKTGKMEEVAKVFYCMVNK